MDFEFNGWWCIEKTKSEYEIWMDFHKVFAGYWNLQPFAENGKVWISFNFDKPADETEAKSLKYLKL